MSWCRTCGNYPCTCSTLSSGSARVLQQGILDAQMGRVSPVPTHVVNPTAEKLKLRLARLDEIEASYLRYLQDRIAERDWHGGWDACVNLSEVSCERDGLLYALEALGDGPRTGGSET